MLKMRTVKGKTYIQKDEKNPLCCGEGLCGISAAMYAVAVSMSLARALGTPYITRIDSRFPARSLIPPAPKTSVKFTESEEEHISDRVIHITA